MQWHGIIFKCSMQISMNTNPQEWFGLAWQLMQACNNYVPWLLWIKSCVLCEAVKPTHPHLINNICCSLDTNFDANWVKSSKPSMAWLQKHCNICHKIVSFTANWRFPQKFLWWYCLKKVWKCIILKLHKTNSEELLVLCFIYKKLNAFKSSHH